MEFAILVLLLTFYQVSGGSDVGTNRGQGFKGRGILNGVSIPKWGNGGHTKKPNQELQKSEPRFWPPVQKESRCK